MVVEIEGISSATESAEKFGGTRWLEVLRWLMTRKPIDWPDTLTIDPKPVASERVYGSDLRITFVNHSTVLIQTEGYNFLTDPIWSKRAGPLGLIGPKRVHVPGVRIEDLPPIDFVLISHNHYDHLDIATVKHLQRLHDPLFCVGQGLRCWLGRRGIFRVQEFNWWQDMRVSSDVTITFVPAQHYARRGLFDHNRTLWGGFVINGERGAVYFAGDTGLGPHIEEIRSFFDTIRLALLPVGAYSPRWFMRTVHMSPDDAVIAHKKLEAISSIGIHFGTFHLSDEGLDDPAKELKSALIRHKVAPEGFRLLEPGEAFDAPVDEE